MNTLTKSEIGRAVTAIRDLTAIIEKLNKATWPAAGESDILRKSDLTDASGISITARSDDARAKASAALATLDALNARLDAVEAQARPPRRQQH